MSVETISISELGRIVTGKTPSTKNPTFFDGEYQFVTPSDLDWKTYYCQATERTVTENARNTHQNQFIPSGAVMVTCIGNTIGKCGLSSDNCLTNQQINSIIPNDESDSRFVYYLLVHNTELIRGVGLGGGAATPILNKTIFSNIKLRVPPARQWNAIASILSAYDDLIENNRRRIQLLEESARLLYKEWFVRLRFPGHEHVKVVDGVPEGWEKKQLREIAATNVRSYNPKTLPERICYVDITSVSTGRINGKKEMPLSEAPGRARRIAKSGEIIWSNVRPNLKAYALVLHPGELDVFSTGFTVITPLKVPFTFLYIATTTKDFVTYLVNRTTGVSYPAVRADDFEIAELLIPSASILKTFQEKTVSMFDQIYVLEEQSKRLAQARDLLLPRLMNGEVAV